MEGSRLHDPPEGAAVSPTGTGTSGLSPLGLCLATPEKTVRWCTVSSHEASKCSSFRENMNKVFDTGPFVSCVKKTSYIDCIKAIMVSRGCLKESERKSILSLSPVVLESFCTHREEAAVWGSQPLVLVKSL